MGIICAGASDIGRKRKSNQDSICVDYDHHFFAVADGMGGHNGGDIASQMTVKMIPEFFSQNATMDPPLLMKNMIQEINRAILQRASDQSELHGMGTTVTAIHFNGPNLVIGNVGDSRVYMINNHHIFQMTRDHTWVQHKLATGYYSREDAVKDPQRNALTIAVGIESDLPVDVFNYRICKNDIFLLCSDGLHGRVSDRDMLQIVQKNIPDPALCEMSHVELAVKELIQQANDNGGNDNISVILAVAKA
jgi:serine/threonine protein phosphatase PrpC